MASAYTPGLTVSGDTVVRRTRLLPIKGEVLVTVGDRVSPETILARAQLPGVLQMVRVGERLGIEANEVPTVMSVRAGDAVVRDQILAESKGLFGFFKQRIESDFVGTVEEVSRLTGSILIREPSSPVEIDAYLDGTVVAVMPGEGASVEARGAMIQGIFGVGGERRGVLRTAVARPDRPLLAEHIRDDDAGRILVGGSEISYEAILRATDAGVIGLVGGGLRDEDLVRLLGYEVGVAITGNEAIPLSLVVTEGFGPLAMAGRTFDLLRSLDGRTASLNGATQIRAGVVRPEIVVPLTDTLVHSPDIGSFELVVGTPIRCIREPYFGRLGTVTELPARLVTLESGTEVRVLRAILENGEEATVPRANVEIVAGRAI